MDLTLKLQHGGMSDVTPEPLRSRHTFEIQFIKLCLAYGNNAAYSDQCSPNKKAWATVVGERMPMYWVCIDAQVYVYNAYIQAIETHKYTCTRICGEKCK